MQRSWTRRGQAHGRESSPVPRQIKQTSSPSQDLRLSVTGEEDSGISMGNDDMLSSVGLVAWWMGHKIMCEGGEGV